MRESVNRITYLSHHRYRFIIHIMNQKEWKTSGKFKGKYEWYNKTRKIQKSLQYNSDEKANRIHHLRDTEEQRRYNDEHYELWGHNLDGTFEYGKYVIFVTEEWHNNYHAQSEETKKKNSDAVRASMTLEVRKRISNSLSGSGNPQYGKRGPQSTCYGRCGELHPMYGKQSAFKGHHFSEESKKKLSESIRAGIKFRDDQYNKYLEIGGSLPKRSFMKVLGEYIKCSYWIQFSFDEFISHNKDSLGLS